MQDINNLELSNHQVQDILDDMGMIDENGNCPYTAEEIFKAGVEYAKEKMIDKAHEWLKKCFYEQEHECDYGYYITLETTFDELNDVMDDFRKAMEEWRHGKLC